LDEAAARGLHAEAIVPEDSGHDRRVDESVAAGVHPRSTGGADAEAADLTARLPPPPVHVWVFVLILFALGTVLSWWAIGGG